MPELPEVEVVRRGLDPVVSGAVVTGVDVHDVRGITRHDPARGDFTQLLTGRRMLGTARRGKFLWIPLESRSGRNGSHGENTGQDEALLAHLGMSGQLLLRPADASFDGDPGLGGTTDPGAQATHDVVGGLNTAGRVVRATSGGASSRRVLVAEEDDAGREVEAARVRLAHVRVVLQLEHPVHGRLAVWFVDQRTFGSLAVDRLRDGGIPSQVSHIAPDLLDPLFDEPAVLERFARTSSAIKRALLDQTLISGIGNIYADEALWAARVHPEVLANKLSRQRARRVLEQARVVLERALAEGGTSFDTQYVNVNGQAGYFARSLNVYGRTGQPCPRCGTPIIRASFMNRSSHLCPRCQRRR